MTSGECEVLRSLRLVEGEPFELDAKGYVEALATLVARDALGVEVELWENQLDAPGPTKTELSIVVVHFDVGRAEADR